MTSVSLCGVSPELRRAATEKHPILNAINQFTPSTYARQKPGCPCRGHYYPDGTLESYDTSDCPEHRPPLRLSVAVLSCHLHTKPPDQLVTALTAHMIPDLANKEVLEYLYTDVPKRFALFWSSRLFTHSHRAVVIGALPLVTGNTEVVLLHRFSSAEPLQTWIETRLNIEVSSLLLVVGRALLVLLPPTRALSNGRVSADKTTRSLDPAPRSLPIHQNTTGAQSRHPTRRGHLPVRRRSR